MQKTQSRSGLATSLRSLAESGSLVDISVADTTHENADVEIRQVGGIYESMVFELPSGLTGCIIDLAIINKTSKTIHCFENYLRLPWEDYLFNWLPDPIEAGKTQCYRFPDRSGLEFHRDLVINHVLLEDGRLRPKCPVRGLLLATGGPMPESLRHGQWVDATLTLTASAEYTSTVHLWTDRLEMKPKRAARTHNLFGEKVGHDMGSVVPLHDEPAVVCHSEIVKPMPISARWRV